MQHFRDTLPYFLGIVEDDAVAHEAQLREARRALRERRRRMSDEENLRGEGIGKAIGLIAEAREAGLISPAFDPSLDDVNAAVAALRAVRDWQVDSPTFEGMGRGNRLRREREHLELHRAELSQALEHARDALDLGGEHRTTVEDHARRLEFIGLYPSDYGVERCPVCDHALENPLPAEQTLNTSLGRLKASLAAIEQDRPQVLAYLEDLQTQLETARSALRDNTTQLQALYQADRAATLAQDRQAHQHRVVGRVSLWLESADFSDDLDGLRREVRLWEGRVEELERVLDPEAKQQRLGALLGRIGHTMTLWARQLHLEHADEGDIRLDLSKLTIVVDKGSRTLELSRIGSGQNWLGYHLVTHFGLHDHLTRERRPTPRFLFLDQPTQVYFPQEQSTATRIKDSGALEPLPDDDRTAVERIFDFLFERVEALEGEFQVIVTDHAHLRDNPRFEAAIVKEWRDGHALIPASWLLEGEIS